MIRLKVDAEDEINARRLLNQMPFVEQFRRPTNAPRGTLDIFVKDAGASLPEVIGGLGQDPSIDMRHAEEYKPPFDDIFIILMERAAAADPQSVEDEVINA